MQLPGYGADQLTETSLDGCVHVLVAALELEVLDLPEDGLETLGQFLGLAGRDDPGSAQHLDVGDRAPDVELEETPVGLVDGEPARHFGHGAVEATSPEGHQPSP